MLVGDSIDMTLTIIMILVGSVGICISVCLIIFLLRGLKKLETRATHFRWLWNNGLHESAYIVGPDTFNWENFG